MKSSDELSWRLDALCRTDDAHLNSIFFPPTNTPEGLTRARQYCDPCPVADECARDAIHYRSEKGVWGGDYGEELIRRRRLENLATEERRARILEIAKAEPGGRTEHESRP